jgi:tetratricopeptide (TPR) repeat protein
MDISAGSRTKVVFAAGLLLIAVVPALAQRPRKVQTPPKPAPRTQAPPPTTPAVDPQKLLDSGQLAQDQGRFDEALATYSRVVGLALRDSKVLALANVKIGSVYLYQKKLDNALASFQRAMALNPELAEAHNYYGEVLGEKKQFTSALEAFNKAVALDPTLLRARYNIGITYARMGNMKYSEFVFRSLVKNSPTYSLGYDGLAVTLSRSGRAREAIPFHEKAISLLPGEPSYYFNLGLSYLMLGDTTKALEQQQKLRTIDVDVADQLASVIIKRRM